MCIVLYIVIYMRFARFMDREERANMELAGVTRNTLLFFGCIILYLAVQTINQVLHQIREKDESVDPNSFLVNIPQIVLMIAAILEFIGITQLIKKSIEAEEVSKRVSLQEGSLWE